MRKKFHLTVLDPYDAELYVIFTKDAQALAKLLKLDSPDDIVPKGNQGAVTATLTSQEELVLVVCFGDSHRLDINTISHESFHVVLRLAEAIGATVCAEHSEPFAYLMGYVVDHLVSFSKLNQPKEA